MSKKIGSILLVLVAVLALNGCDSGVYSAEKRFWHASKAYNELVKAPEKATQVDYQKIIDSFREITIRYPTWPDSAQAQFNIGQLYAMQGNLSKAKDEFGAILNDYSQNVDMCANGLFMITLIYEKEDNWPRAKESLDKITDSYPNTATAFQVPIHIAEYYKRRGQNSEAETTYAAALDKYKKVIKENPKSYGAVMAIDLIVTCYVDREQWNEALDYLSGLVNDYSDTALAPKALFIEGAIYEQKLSQPNKAIELYREIIQKYPKTPFAKTAQKQIKTLNKPQ